MKIVVKKLIAVCLMAIMICGASGVVFAADGFSAPAVSVNASGDNLISPRMIYHLDKSKTVSVGGNKATITVTLDCKDNPSTASQLEIIGVQGDATAVKKSGWAYVDSNAEVISYDIVNSGQRAYIDVRYYAREQGESSTQEHTATISVSL